MKVRQALSFSLDREKLIREYLKGGQKPAGGIIPEGMPESAQGGDFHRNSEKKVPAGDEKKASALLAEAGFSEGKGFPETELLVSEQEGHRYFAEKIRQEWQEKLGLKLQIVTLSWPELRERMSKRDYQLALMGWSADFADPRLLQSFMREAAIIPRLGQSRIRSVAGKGCFRRKRGGAERPLHQAENILLEEGRSCLCTSLPKYTRHGMWCRICLFLHWDSVLTSGRFILLNRKTEGTIEMIF